MKNCLLIIIPFILGTIIGIMVFEKFYSESNKVGALISISELESMVSMIYETGEIESSIIALKYLTKKIETYKDTMGEADLYNTDKGFAHGRLCILYKKKGEKDLAEMHCKEAIKLLNKNYKIKTKEKLIQIIQKIDANHASAQ